MDSQKIKPEVCTEIPILDRLVKKIVECLDGNAPFDGLFTLVKEMAKEMQRQQLIPVNKVIKLFQDEDATEYDQLRTLFHTLHPKMLRSLVLGMVPYDLSEKDSPNWKVVYDSNGSGTYLAGISIEGRHGAFLTSKEIDLVIQHIEDYKKGCEVWLNNKDTYGLSHVTPEQEGHLKKALLIDNHIHIKSKQWREGDDYRQPACISGEEDTHNIDALVAMLRRRVNPNFDPDVPQVSSPAYADCSHNVSQAMPNHDPDNSSLLSSSNVWRLLILCIQYIGLRVIVRTVPIIMVWEESQIQLSEVLVTVLSQSLITQNGLNVIQPGTSSSSNDVNQALLDGMKEHVWVRCPWFMDNVTRSLEVRTANRDILQWGYNKILEQEVENSIEKIRALIEENDRKEAEIESKRVEIVETLNRIEAQHEAARQVLREVDDFLEMSRGMFPDLPEVGDDSGSDS
ncbi:hypothetical protein M434DRAFT_9022 [Hypoxylon sp. CO27-5]|nr:hypothetical protein M434DRAFT_9022 [Hypoxylon sp. CO27-5]